MLQFRTEVGGLDVSGVDMITWDDDGQIVDFTVMVRPAKALQAVIEHMGAELLRMLRRRASRGHMTMRRPARRPGMGQPHREASRLPPVEPGDSRRPPPDQSPKCSRYDDAGPREPR